MKRKLKEGIQKAFEAPKPDQKEKEKFLRTLPQPHISMMRFVLIQAAYLRKRTLIVSMLLLFPALMGTYCVDLNTLWDVSAIIPFLGLLTIAENARSMMYGMEEFEMSTRFSLKSVILARMSVLGLTNVFLFFCLAFLGCMKSGRSFIQTGIYLFVPYLLTVNISLWITRHFRGREVVYACSSVAVLVSAAGMGLRLKADFVYQFVYVKWWLLLSAVLVGIMIYETYCTIKQTEELAWNL